MNEKSLYYSMVFYFMHQTNLRLERKKENAAWFRDENNTIFVLERNDFPWKKQYIECTQKFIAELLTVYDEKIRPTSIVRMTFATRVPYEFTDQKDIVGFKNGQMQHYIVSEKISLEKFERLGQEILGFEEKNQYFEDVDQIEQNFYEASVVSKAEIAPVKNASPIYIGKKAVITPVFMGIIIFSFIFLQKMQGDNIELLINLGAKVNSLILAGEWWRLITPVFLHGSILHLGMNMLAMYYIGQDIERFYGKWRYVTIFFLSLLGGSIASFVFNTSVSVGASGAVFGLFGALLYICFFYKDRISPVYRKNIFTLIAVNIVFGFLMPGIDQMAHLGGFIIGYLSGVALGFPKNSINVKRFIILIFVPIFIIGFYMFGVAKNQAIFENGSDAAKYDFQEVRQADTKKQ